MKSSNRVRVALLVFVAVLAGIAAACSRGKSAPSPAGGSASANRWRCAMHPQIVKDAPGTCPICHMDLVPVDGASSPPSAAPGLPGLSPVVVDAARRPLLSIRTEAVARAPFVASIRTVGRVAWDERRVHHVHTRYDAFVEHVSADFTGKFVRKGEILASVYAPELYATQQEYLLARRAVAALGTGADEAAREGARRLAGAARERLRLWEMGDDQVADLERRGEPLRALDIRSPISGFVTARTAYHGMKVTAADTLFDIADLSVVWVLADVYEYELPRVRLGARGTMTLSYEPGRTWRGTVSYVYPTLDEKTRTARVRLEFENPGGALKPEMFADVEIETARRTALLVAEDAVLDSGTRKIVFVDAAAGRLQPREVTLGGRADGRFEVLAGISEGEKVVRGATFLVDSESRLRSALDAIAPSGAAPGTPPAAPDPHAGHR